MSSASMVLSAASATSGGDGSRRKAPRHAVQLKTDISSTRPKTSARARQRGQSRGSGEKGENTADLYARPSETASPDRNASSSPASNHTPQQDSHLSSRSRTREWSETWP